MHIHDQKEKDNRTNNNLQSTTQKTKDRAIRTTVNLGDVEGSAVHVPLVTTVMLRLIQIVFCHE